MLKIRVRIKDVIAAISIPWATKVVLKDLGMRYPPLEVDSSFNLVQTMLNNQLLCQMTLILLIITY